MQPQFHVAPQVREQLQNTLPAKERKHLSKYLYILSQTHLQYCLHRKEYDRLHNGFTPLQATLLQKICGNRYKAYLDYLIAQEYLQTDSRYQVGKKATGYKLHPRITMHNPAPTATGKEFGKKIVAIKAKDAYTPRNTQERYLKKQLNQFTITPQALEQIALEGNKATDLTLYHAILQGEHLFERGETGHRLFTTYTSLKRTLRPCLQHVSGAPLYETDIRNSQPLILCALFPDHYKSAPLPADALHYRSLCENGQFYDVMLQEMQKGHGEYMAKEYGGKTEQQVRKAFKVDMFALVFYCRNSNLKHPVRDTFKRLFPTVWQLIRAYKKHDYRQLSQLMQQKERKVMIDYTCSRLIARFNGTIPLLTIHDSIITTEPYKDAVKAEIERAMFELYELRPTVSLEKLA